MEKNLKVEEERVGKKEKEKDTRLSSRERQPAGVEIASRAMCPTAWARGSVLVARRGRKIERERGREREREKLSVVSFFIFLAQNTFFHISLFPYLSRPLPVFTFPSFSITFSIFLSIFLFLSLSLLCPLFYTPTSPEPSEVRPPVVPSPDPDSAWPVGPRRVMPNRSTTSKRSEE